MFSSSRKRHTLAAPRSKLAPARAKRLTNRRPVLECLETRHLMATDVIREWNDLMLDANARDHSLMRPEQPSLIDGEGTCSPIDALTIINELNSGDTHRSRNFIDVNGDGSRSPLDALMVVNRLNSGVTEPETAQPAAARLPPPTTVEFRTFDGTRNNSAHPEWGSANETLLRIAPADYEDGISAPAGSDRLSARDISNLLATHSAMATPNDRDLTAFIYVWGQFLDHDLSRTGVASRLEPFPVEVPADDPVFDPEGTGTMTLPFNRSAYDPSTGTSVNQPRQQVTQVTSWIDASMIYGSDEATARSLRTLSGGRLKTSAGDLPPQDSAGNFLAGDVRANENIELTSLHTIFVREHNRIADQIAAANPSLSDELVFQRARAHVIGEIQSITYNEWLPALLGQNALRAYRGYNATVNPSIANEFSTAAFRLHSSINDDVEFFDDDGRPIFFTYQDADGNTVTVHGEISLRDAFFNPGMFRQTGVDGILKYAASTHMEEIDNQVVDSLRNFLFVLPAGGLDLASLNIQRGRDHGLADYNTVRASYGLARVTSFSQITSDTELQEKLQQAYGTVDNIDVWVGGLAEDHVRGSSMGPLFQRIIVDQFQRLRDADRFWYQRTFSGRELSQLERTSLSDIIERNSDVTSLQDNVFIFRAEASGSVFRDRDGDGIRDRGEAGMANVTVQLLNAEGTVLASTLTARDGRYRLSEFPETGDYHVRVIAPTGWAATTDDAFDVWIASGDIRARNLDFGLGTAPANAAAVTSFDASMNEWFASSESGQSSSRHRRAKTAGWQDAVDTVFGQDLG